MNKAVELFDKILVDGQEISLASLDANNGIYSVGQAKANQQVNVKFVLKNKNTIPAYLFSGLSYLKSVTIPESVTTIGAYAFARTHATVSGITNKLTSIGDGAFDDVVLDSESVEIINNLNPNSYVQRYTAEEAAAHNLTLGGARQYGDIKTYTHYSNEEINEHNANLWDENSYYEVEAQLNTYFNYIHDEASWNDSFTYGGLKKYYAANPEEDLWYEKLVYSFTSYGDAGATTKYGEGTVEVTDLRADGATVKVLTNEALDENAEDFVGQEFNVNSLDVDENTVLQLSTLENEPVNIWVKVQLNQDLTVSRKSEITDKRVDFESYADDQGTTKYGAGIVQVLEENPWTDSKNYMKVKVLTNVPVNEDDENAQTFINREFYVVKTAKVDNKTLYQLYTGLETIDGKQNPSSPIDVWVKLIRYYYPYCKQNWKGAYLNTGARYPWIVPYFDGDSDINAKIRFEYTGKSPVHPWRDNKFGKGKKQDGSDRLYGCASVAVEFKDKGFLITENQNNYEADWTGEVGANNFDINNFKMILERYYSNIEITTHNAEVVEWDEGTVKEAIPYTNAEVDTYNAGLDGAVHAGDIK